MGEILHSPRYLRTAIHGLARHGREGLLGVLACRMAALEASAVEPWLRTVALRTIADGAAMAPGKMTLGAFGRRQGCR